MCRKALVAVALSFLVVISQAGCGGGGSNPSAGSSVVSGTDGASSTGSSSDTASTAGDSSAGATDGSVVPGGSAVPGGGVVPGGSAVPGGGVVPGGTSGSGVAKLSWNQNVEGAAGFKVYVGTSPGSYSSPINVGLVPSYTLSGLAPGTYYIAVTAYDVMGNESAYSNEVSKTIS